MKKTTGLQRSFRGSTRPGGARLQSKMVKRGKAKNPKFVRESPGQRCDESLAWLLEAQGLRVDIMNGYEGSYYDAPEIILQDPGLHWICHEPDHSIGVRCESRLVHLFDPVQGVYEYSNMEVFSEDFRYLLCACDLTTEVELLPIVNAATSAFDLDD